VRPIGIKLKGKNRNGYRKGRLLEEAAAYGVYLSTSGTCNGAAGPWRVPCGVGDGMVSGHENWYCGKRD
jgi:hypothetical protein